MPGAWEVPGWKMGKCLWKIIYYYLLTIESCYLLAVMAKKSNH